MTTPTITRVKYPALRAWINTQPWAIQPEAGQRLLSYLEHRMTAEMIADVEKPRARRDNGAIPTKTGGAIAVLPLYGPIAQRMDMMMAYCGGTSAERFADEFDAAMADPNVSAIVFDCDSPGGSVQGTPELAKRIFSARGKGKKLIAVSNGQMCSAAYWISSACDEIVASPSSDTGSIGVFCVHFDESGYDALQGFKYTIIKAGEHKAEGNPFEPLSEDAEAYIQTQVDEMYDSFVSAIAKQRGVSTTVVNRDFGQGRTMTAKQALASGLVDRIATLEETLNKLGAKDVGMSGRPRRPFGAAAATTNDLREIVEPIKVSTGGPRAEDTPVDAPDPDDEELCPECGKPLDANRTCESCGARADEPTDDDDEDQPTTDDSARAHGEAGAATRAAASPGFIEPSPEDLNMGASTQPVAAGSDAAVKAERDRVKAIRKLGQKHGVTEEQIDAMVDEGLSIDQAATRILTNVEARATGAPVIRVGADREADRPFVSFGEQLRAVITAGRTGRRDARLTRVNHNATQIDHATANEMFAGASGQNESVGSEGGFFIAPEVLPGVIEPIYQDDPFLSRVTRIPIGSSSNRTVYNVVDESSRVDGSRWGGVQIFYADEADTVTAKKYKLRQVEQVLKKLMGIGYLTDEMMVDAPASEALLTKAYTTELRFMLVNEMFRGLGGARITGFLNGKGGVNQAIEATQTKANTPSFLALNVPKMKANIPSGLWGELIWAYNQEHLSNLMTASIGGNGAVPLFVPSSGALSGATAVDRILGNEAYASELCEAVGTPGDFLCIAPSQYHYAEKGGAQIATSLHVRFLNDEMAIRLTYRADGKSVWNTTVTPFKGSTARGFFSTLAARA